MRVVVPASTVTLLEQVRECLDSKAHGSVARPRKSLPQWLPNGEPITSLSELAAVLSTDKKTAAYVTLLAVEPPARLVKEAKAVIHTQR